MFTAIIADDEPNVIDELQYLIDWEEQGIEICATAENGEQAIRLAAEKKPDFLFCDISMPKKNGIEVLCEVKRLLPDLVFVAISAYSEFEYARQCLTHGAFGYLLKTIDRGELLSVITRGKEAIEKRRKEGEGYGKLMLAYRLVSQDGDCAGQLAKLGYPAFPRNRILLLPSPPPELAPSPSLLPLGGTDRYMLLFGYENEEEFDALRARLAPLAASLPGQKPHRLYRQADVAYTSRKFYPKDVSIYSPPREKTIAQLAEACGKAQSQGDRKLLLGQLTAKLTTTEELAQLYNRVSGDAEAMDYTDIYESFGDLAGFLDDLLRQTAALDDSTSSAMLDDIAAYLDGNFDQEISIGTLAQKYYISMGYLNNSFKKRFGVPINRYLINLRMKKAVYLMERTDLNLIQISQAIGYSDFYYFSRLFKKIYGVPPSQFRSASPRE